MSIDTSRIFPKEVAIGCTAIRSVRRNNVSNHSGFPPTAQAGNRGPAREETATCALGLVLDLAAFGELQLGSSPTASEATGCV